MPLPKRQLDKIREIQELQLATETRMAESLPKIFEELSRQTIDLAADIPLNPNKRAEALRQMIDMKRKLAELVALNPLYQKEVEAVISSYSTFKKLADQYVGMVFDNYNPKVELYEAILKTNIETTVDNLIGSGIRENFKNAITQVLKENISGQSSRTQLNKVLRQFIEGNPDEKPFLERYIKQTTNDSLMGFQREYIQTVSDDLDLNYYFYAGTLIADSRPFCQARTGRYYTKEQVQSWASLGDWQGRMAGTTKITIFTNAGGYNCRHTIWPVSDAQYKQAEKENVAGMK